MRMTFDEWYAISKEYYKEFNNLEVPTNYVTRDGKKLGKYLAHLREAFNGYGTMALTSDRIALYDALGMNWGRVNLTWDEAYLKAKEYYLEYGNLLVPFNYVCDDKYNLGVWISSQRKKYNGTIDTKLTKKQIDLLESIDMIWKVDLTFEEYYSLCEEYYNEHNNLLIPERYVTKSGVHLGLFISNLRKDYKKEKLTKDKIDQMNKLHMSWGTDMISVNSKRRLLLEFNSYLDKLKKRNITSYNDILNINKGFTKKISKW